MREILDFLKDNILPILSFLGIGSLAGIAVRFNWFRRNLASFNAEPFLPTVPLKILVSPLLHDPKNRQTDHVLDALRTHLKAGEVQGHCDYRVLPKSVHPKPFATGSAQAQSIAKRIQRQIALYNADLMIWGHVVKDDQTLHLSITARQGGNDRGNRRYALDGPTLRLRGWRAGFDEHSLGIAVGRGRPELGAWRDSGDQVDQVLDDLGRHLAIGGKPVFELGCRGIAEAIQIDLKSTVYSSRRS